MGFFQWLNNTYGGAPDVPVPEAASAKQVRRRFRFSGVVQGVGFRYEAQRIASGLDLVGWVRNERDGSVVVEVQGASNYVEAFLLAVEAVARFDITDIQAEDLPLSQTETAFRIRY